MKFKCPHCGTVMGCIECTGFMCDGCGSDLKDSTPTPPAGEEPVVCKLNPWGYDPIDNDNDSEEVWDD